MTTPDPCHRPVFIVVDTDDDVACMNTAWGAHDPAAGVIAIHPTPGAGGVGDICLDVLNALGKPIDQANALAGPGGREIRIGHAATAWTHAEGIWHFIVMRAHLLTRAQRTRLIELGSDVHAVVTMVWHTTASRDWSEELPGHHGWKLMPSLQQAIVAARFDRKPWRTSASPPRALHCTSKGREPSPYAEQDAEKRTLPPLPASDFPNFRADAYRRLGLFTHHDDKQYAVFGSQGFELVDAVYGYGMDLACTWILGQDEFQNPPEASVSSRLALQALGQEEDDRLERSALAAAAPIPAALARQVSDPGPVHLEPYPYLVDNDRGLRLFLANLVADCPTREHAIARIRGAQAGFFAHGLLLAVPPLLDRATGRGLMARLDLDQAERIRDGVLHPVHAAALAAALFTGADPADLPMVRLAALSRDGATLDLVESPVQGYRLAGEKLTYGVPVYARSLMLAARHFLQLCGHDALAPLLEAGIGRDGQQLLATSRLVAVSAPVCLDRRAGQLPWDLRTRCWRVGQALHRRGPATLWDGAVAQDSDA